MSQANIATKLTQKQIAEQLGVSRQLVGFALTGRGQVNEQTRQRILEFAQQNGYHQYSNHEARAMASRRFGKRAATGLLAVLFESAFESQPLASVPFFVPLFQGLEAEADERDLELMLSPMRDLTLPRIVRDRQVDGVICLSAPREVSAQVHELGLPVINFQTEVPGIPSVLVDNDGGTQLAVSHLVGLGHKRIGFLAFDAPSGARKLQAFQKELCAENVSYDPELVDVGLPRPTIAAGADAMRQMLARLGRSPGEHSNPGFTALVCHNDLIAMGAVRVLQDIGWHVPNDVSVVGFDDVSDQYAFVPEITSIRFSRRDMGRRAIQMLNEYAEFTSATGIDAELKFPSTTVFPTSLMQRASTAATTSG